MRSLLGVSLVCVVACGGGVDVDVNDDNACSEIAEVACHNMYRCCSQGEIEDFLGVNVLRTEEQCRVDVSRLCERARARVDAGIEANRVRFEPDRMNDCLEALVAPGDACAVVGTTIPWAAACLDSAWVGLVADGGQCFGTFECGRDSLCTANQKCTARPANGQPCSTIPCARGHYCELGMCRTQKTQGQSCQDQGECVDPLVCDPFLFICTGNQQVVADYCDGALADLPFPSN